MYLEETDVELDEEGYIKTTGGFSGGQTGTDVPGIFGAGDVVDHYYQQAITAGGMGCKAALDTDNFLEEVDTFDSTSASAASETD